jgi:hypothetical protein
MKQGKTRNESVNGGGNMIQMSKGTEHGYQKGIGK